MKGKLKAYALSPQLISLSDDDYGISYPRRLDIVGLLWMILRRWKMLLVVDGREAGFGESGCKFVFSCPL